MGRSNLHLCSAPYFSSNVSPTLDKSLCTCCRSIIVAIDPTAGFYHLSCRGVEKKTEKCSMYEDWSAVQYHIQNSTQHPCLLIFSLDLTPFFCQWGWFRICLQFEYPSTLPRDGVILHKCSQWPTTPLNMKTLHIWVHSALLGFHFSVSSDYKMLLFWELCTSLNEFQLNTMSSNALIHSSIIWDDVLTLYNLYCICCHVEPSDGSLLGVAKLPYSSLYSISSHKWTFHFSSWAFGFGLFARSSYNLEPVK